MKLIWATRGRTWGFRFLDSGGFDDPLGLYDDMFVGLEGDREACRRSGDHVAVRFPDPQERVDAAGRVIPHDFIVLGPAELVDQIDSVDTARRIIWPAVSNRFDRIWNDPDPAMLRG